MEYKVMNKTVRTILIVLAIMVAAVAVIAIGVFVFRGVAGGLFHHPILMEGSRNFQNPGGRFIGPRMTSGYSPFGFFGGILARLAGFGLLAALIALLVWAAIRLFGARNGHLTSARSADALSVQEILDRRYARGEISREDYLQVLKDTGNPAPDMPEPPQEPTTEA
jgi:uncharacterized membrane protein